VPDNPRKPVPVARYVVAGVLLVIAIVAPLLVNTYSSETPRLWGFPFFFWYQLLWVLIASVLTFGAYLIVERGRK
jgi:hypothetical protein